MDIEKTADAIFNSVEAYITKRLAPLQAEVKELRSRPEPHYCGVWTDGTYDPGALVTDHGSMWYCNETTSSRPGSSKSWSLSVKRGVPR
ncbi:hypothetical protein [Phyllobacterium chamaecytisi]|uniref:hypothetical protein n=1 Tax=Phyllobacterium chamaecytisi TaxID=2876082 RepID=UPI001CCCBF15|nr:hypothetical protein [Phyllobacterium sp. KW56]MBZ9604266.1 hypothetical protein [Phyllobacterium sp. KW56]